MVSLKRVRPTPAMAVALVALVAAMSGAAVALPGKNKVQSNDIKKGAVTKKKIAKGAVGSQQIIGKSIKGNRLKDGAVKSKQMADNAVTTPKIAADAVTAEKVGDNALSSAEISDYKVASTGIITATDGADEAAARAAAPEQALFSKGELTIYAKCFRDTGTDTVFGDIYARTSANGSILDADDDLDGDPAFLDTNTAEAEAQIESGATALANTANSTEGEFMAMSPDGTRLVGQHGVAVKNGDLAGGNGMYGAGNVCVFDLEVAG